MSAPLLQLKLTLAGVRPPVWRRLYVSNQASLAKLHEIIQAVAGWSDQHPHEFAIAEQRFGRPAPHEVVPVRNEALYRLHSLGLTQGHGFTYVYDFGDHWEIELTVEGVLPRDTGGSSPLLLDGARAFPPEDSGGAEGYADLIEALSDPAHPEHDECRRWAGDDFDPERFDFDETNARLLAL